MSIIDGKFAAFVVDIEKAFDAAFEKYGKDLDAHGPLGFYITSVDGIAARFWDEGIEFYPKNVEIVDRAGGA